MGVFLTEVNVVNNLFSFLLFIPHCPCNTFCHSISIATTSYAMISFDEKYNIINMFLFQGLKGLI